MKAAIALSQTSAGDFRAKQENINQLQKDLNELKVQNFNEVS
jgi:hypothetical protein